MYYLSPLRYPGGKGEMAAFLTRVAEAQYPRVSEYAEPFAGGAGAALRLLADEAVRIIHINDLNPGIFAMWKSVTQEPDRFADRILQQAADIEAWHRAREIYLAPADHDTFEVGFATFLLNRWNRSGILTARPIGGMNQDGPWKIDARFNRDDLADRVRFIGDYAGRIKVTGVDAREFITDMEEAHPDALVYVDPPYLTQAEDLYYDLLSAEDHRALANQLRRSHLRWLLTYDVDLRITNELYPDLRCAQFNIAHTAHDQHVGAEYVVFSERLVVPDLKILRRKAEAEWVAC